jgi:hypothetical protein
MDEDDPRGVAAPPDPHGDEETGVGRDGQYEGATRESNHCERCGDMIRPAKTYCQSCRDDTMLEEAGFEEPPSEHEESEPVSWSFERVGIAVVDAELDLIASAKGKSALKLRADLPSLPVDAKKDDSVDGVDDIDGEPHEVLQRDWPHLEESSELETKHGEQIARTALDKHDPSDHPTLYDEAGMPLQGVSTIADLKTIVDGDSAWLVPGFLYSLPPDGSGDEDAPSSRRVSKEKLLCMRSNDQTVHVYETKEDGMDWWECQECGKWRPGPALDQT